MELHLGNYKGLKGFTNSLVFRLSGLLSLGIVSLGIIVSGLAQAQVSEEPQRDVSKYNLFVPGENLNGYDPVAYFPEGGEQPQLGQEAFRLDYMGVTYFFASQQNLELFLLQPAKYEPTYGQWCAWAMANGSYVKINPLIFTVNGNRLHFFVSRRAKFNFDSNITESESSADNNWKQYSGEEPRL